MSNRLAIILGIAVALLVAAILTDYGRVFPAVRDWWDRVAGKTPEARENSDRRPERRDLALVERFSGTPVDDIVAMLERERAEDGGEGAKFPGPDGDSPDAPMDRAPASGDERGDPEEERFPATLELLEEPPFRPPVAFADLDGDGNGEIVSHGGARLFEIGPDGEAAPLVGLGGVVPAEGIVPGDFDGDERIDLFLIRGGGLPNSLLHNLGVDGASGGVRFEEITEEAGLLAFGDTAAATWLDYDGDGLLDLAVADRDGVLELFQQSGGVFEPVAWERGLRVASGATGLVAADTDGTGRPELLVSVEGRPGRFYRSVISPGTGTVDFVESAEAAGLGEAAAWGAAVFFDLDNDGDLDLAMGVRGDGSEAGGTEADSGEEGSGETAVYAPPSATLRIFLNDGEGAFTEAAADVGLEDVVGVCALEVADLDGDGFEDLLVGTDAGVPNRVFWNREGLDFREVSVLSGWHSAEVLKAIAAGVAGSSDGDGTIDLLASAGEGRLRWWRSHGGEGDRLTVDLRGWGPGIRVSLVVRDRDWVLREVHRVAGPGSHRVSLGLGPVQRVERVDIYRPGGSEPVATLESVEPNQEIAIPLSAGRQ